MSWDPFLIKKWLKSGICGTMNSAFVHCSRLTWSNSAARTKKKGRNVIFTKRRCTTPNPNGHYEGTITDNQDSKPLLFLTMSLEQALSKHSV